MNRFLAGCVFISIGALVWFSLHLAGIRIFQVDECAEVFCGQLLASGRASEHAMGIALLQFPISWLAKGAASSEQLLTACRFVMVEIFWLNIVLLAVATGEKLRSARGLVALLGAATLAPLWDYGFEIRHDNLLLTGLLLTWCTVRVHPNGWKSFFGAGLLAVAMQFAAHKAFAYWVPLTLAILLFPPPGISLPRWKLALSWVAGAVVMFAVLRIVYALHGTAEITKTSDAGVKFVSQVAVSENRFWPWRTLARLLGQTPLVLALGAAAVLAVVVELRKQGRSALSWDGCLPETLLFLGTLGLLFVNPTPFPYNLLHFVPFAYLLAYRHAARLWKDVKLSPGLLAVAASILVFTHLATFSVATRRHLDWTNSRQIGLMSYAESLTDPAKDPVYDGVGLVSTRPIVDPAAFLHSLTVQNLKQPGSIRLAHMLAARPAAVIMPNYRTEWLTEEDHEFIEKHYVPLADDFWVLGKLLPAKGGEFEIIYPGRYLITTKEASCIRGTVVFKGPLVIAPVKTNLVGTLDGQPLTGKPIELKRGRYRVETTEEFEPAVVWVGPHLERLTPLYDMSRMRLYINWY